MSAPPETPPLPDDPRVAKFLDEVGEWLARFAHDLSRESSVYRALRGRADVAWLLAQVPDWLADGGEERARKAMKNLRRTLDRELFELRRKSEALAKSALRGHGGRLAAGGPRRLSTEERVVLRTVLSRLRLLDPGDNVPEPDDSFTGVRGASRVFLFYLPHGSLGRRFIVKFDDPRRAEREWQAIGTLRLLNMPPETILPHPENVKEDGVLVYPAAGSHRHNPVETLRAYLTQCLVRAPAACLRCLELTLEPLLFFYDIEPGRLTDRAPATNRPLVWGQFYPLVPEAPDLGAWLSGLVPGVDGDASALVFASGLRPLPNPVHGLADFLGKPTGVLRLSRVHGDLNLTNVLVSTAPDRSPRKINIIDVACSVTSQPTAMDLARLETAFWLEVFLGLVEQDHLDSEAWIADLIAVHDFLADRLSAPPPPLTPMAPGTITLIYHLRRRAARILEPSGQQGYVMADYFQCLYLTWLSMLRFEELRLNPSQMTMAFLSAAVTLEYLKDVESSCYAEGARGRRQPPTRLIPQLESFGDPYEASQSKSNSEPSQIASAPPEIAV